MRRLIAIFGLEVYAVLLAYIHSLHGVLTDEAKYLLNIPYPHPPLIRTLLSQLEVLADQEMIVRIVFATIVVQAVWLLWRLSKNLIVCSAWLLSAAVIFQAGTIYMAPLTAIQGLVLLFFLLSNPNTEHRTPNTEIVIALFWLLSLFTAYQSILFLPLVIGIFWKRDIPVFHKLTYIFGPVIVLGLYSLSNPFSLVSMFVHGGRDLDSTLVDRLILTARLWAIGGSIVLSAVGTWGLLRFWRWDILVSFLLVVAYVALSRYDYYAILFTPFFCVGLHFLCLRRRFPKKLFIGAMVVSALWYGATQFPFMQPSLAADIMNRIPDSDGEYVLINGYFGHQWQYESNVPVRRYRHDIVDSARVVICITSCEEMDKRDDWQKVLIEPVEAYVPNPSYSPLPVGEGLRERGDG
jgi:hypothetical protein